MKNLISMLEKNYSDKMKNAIKTTFLIALLLGIFSCTPKHIEEEKKGFQLSDTLMNRIKVEKATVQAVQSELRLTGKVIADENNVVKVYPLLGGYVQSVYVQLGDFVEKGSPLAVIKSGEVAEFEKQLINAQSNLLIAQKT